MRIILPAAEVETFVPPKICSIVPDGEAVPESVSTCKLDSIVTGLKK
jgi:hypothetical protein